MLSSTHSETHVSVSICTPESAYPRFHDAILSTKYFDDEPELVYYGYRYYSPELGRWSNRDPIREEGSENIYAMVGNDPVDSVDPLGDRILSMEVRGTGSSWIETIWPGEWKNSLESTWKNAGQGGNLGFHMGKGYITTLWSIIIGSEGSPAAVGLWKFEAKGKWCDDSGLPSWKAYRSNVKVLRKKKSTGAISTIFDEPAETLDGPTGHFVSTVEPPLQNADGTYTTYAWDAPRIAPKFKDPAKYRYYFFGTWRLVLEDSVNKWEAKFKLGFSWDNDADPASAGTGYFAILSGPAEVP